MANTAITRFVGHVLDNGVELLFYDDHVDIVSPDEELIASLDYNFLMENIMKARIDYYNTVETDESPKTVVEVEEKNE